MIIDQPHKDPTSLSIMISSATLSELNCALKNLRGGKNHVLALIGPRDFHNLMQKGKIQSHDSHLYADLEEKSGNALRMIITVSTSGLGIWMGLNDFLASGHRSWQQLVWVSVLSTLIGVVISFLSYYFAAKRADKAILQKKLINLQDFFLNKMIEKIEKKISETKDKLYKNLLKLDDKTVVSEYTSFFAEENKEKLSKKSHDILATLHNKMESELNLLTATTPFSHYLFNSIFNQFKKIIVAKTKNISLTCPQASPENRPAQTKAELLFELPKHFTKSKMTFASWLVASSLGIFLETIPVFVGTFGAIFLFLNGLPDTFKKIGYDHVTEYFNHPAFKYGSLSLAILFVIYLGASQVKFSYKSYLRSKNIEDAQSKVVAKEVKYTGLHSQYILSNKFSKILKRLLNMLNLSQTRER